MRNWRHVMVTVGLLMSCATVPRPVESYLDPSFGRAPAGEPKVPGATAPVEPPPKVEPRPREVASQPAILPVGPGQRPEELAPGVRRDVYWPEFVPRPVPCPDVVRLAKDVAARHRLEHALVVGVMRVESGFVANVISPAGAVGLMQVMPSSGKREGCGDLFSPDDNVECGARILAAFLRHYNNNLLLALSGYNAGHAMPDQARSAQRVPRNFQYVENVLRARARFLRFGCKAWED